MGHTLLSAALGTTLTLKAEGEGERERGRREGGRKIERGWVGGREEARGGE